MKLPTIEIGYEHGEVIVAFEEREIDERFVTRFFELFQSAAAQFIMEQATDRVLAQFKGAVHELLTRCINDGTLVKDLNGLWSFVELPCDCCGAETIDACSCAWSGGQLN